MKSIFLPYSSAFLRMPTSLVLTSSGQPVDLDRDIVPVPEVPPIARVSGVRSWTLPSANDTGATSDQLCWQADRVILWVEIDHRLLACPRQQ